MDATSILTMENLQSTDRKGHLSLGLAAVFVVAEMAGSGVLALPKAMADSGWSGIFMLIFCCLNSLYAGICLGRCWSMLEERYEEYRQHNRYPYPAIAFRAYGRPMKIFVSVCMAINLLGVSTVFLLLSSQMVAKVAAASGLSFCHWVLLMAALLCPLMWLGTPQDFWPAAVFALLTTVIACIILVVLMAKESAKAHFAHHPAPSVEQFFLAFGTILFAFGGAASFPTFQNDMKNRTDFPKAAAIGFLVLLLLYMPVAVMGYVIFGDAIDDNVVLSLDESPSRTAISVLLALHMLFAFLIVINATAQEFEEALHVPNKFGWRRVLVRTSLLLLVVAVAESIPRFGKVLNLVGGSAITLTASVFPCVFYYKLCSQPPYRQIPLYEKLYLMMIVVCGIVGGCMATYSAIKDIVSSNTFVPPCYINSTAAEL